MGGNKDLKPQNGVQVRQTSIFSGPIPPPELLQRYNDIIPNAADRILAIAENQSTHRQKIEEIAIRGDDKRASRGQIFGFVVAMTALLGGFYLIGIGKDGYGISSIIASLATLTGVFVYGSISRRKEREKKLAEARRIPQQNR